MKLHHLRVFTVSDYGISILLNLQVQVLLWKTILNFVLMSVPIYLELLVRS